MSDKDFLKKEYAAPSFCEAELSAFAVCAGSGMTVEGITDDGDYAF